MATSAFKSTSRRTTTNSSTSKPLVRKRSLSVSAVSRTSSQQQQQLDFDTEFLNKCDNPLFWTDNDKIKVKDNDNLGVVTRKSNGVVEERGRTVTRSVDNGNGIGRSVSRVRGRSVSRGHYRSAYESEKELQSNIVQRVSSKKVADTSRSSNLVSNDANRSGKAKSSTGSIRHGQVTDCSEDDSACSVHISNWEDGVSACSFSEAEEKTIKAVCEQMTSVRSDQWGADSATGGIYETVRSEVRRAISDIQIDLENAIRRDNCSTTANVADIAPNLVDPGAAELVLDIRREYARKLDESEERARKLRSDLAVEEHRGQEISRILKEILSDPKPSPPQRSRAGRKRSNERKKISKRLTEEALTYFDECVSISTFDSSDFSAPEDPSRSSVGATTRTGVTAPLSPSTTSTSFPIVASHIKHTDSHEDSSLTANSYNDESLLDKRRGSDPGRGQQFQFSFGHKSPGNDRTHDDLLSYIKNFEKDANKDLFNSDSTRAFYDANEYKLQSHTESLLFGRVIFRNRIDSGGLHLCNGGFPVTCFPFGFA